MPRVLVLALDNWLGASRLPRALQRVGFDVSLICYPNTLISLTRFADERDLCLPTDSAEVVAQRLVTLIRSHPPRLIVPVDDRALRFLQHIVEVDRLGVLPRDLTALVRASLPDPSAFVYGDDKEAACRMMEEHGVPTPKRATIESASDLREFVSSVGLPVVVKPRQGTAGEGVHFIRTETDLAGIAMTGQGGWIAQQAIVGKPASGTAVALEGKLLGGIAWEKTLTYPGETGPATLASRLDDERFERAATAFAKLTSFNGYYSVGFMVEGGTGDPYFLEVNTRPVPMTPVAGFIGLDLCACLYARMVGAPLPKLDLAAPNRIAFYPQELHRDPNSENRRLILDEPLDDPEVHRAMEKGIALLAATGKAH